ncbi:hypothetical protein ONE63_003299 [Megalurothrips usitatus]|uniref:Uncharacterized protein n=1 Tax=Megalurothrips usitatus TaxID=439358 RepID=A0AAV7X6V7_9NEOP|nr:hypothetical protein ONE63_003299 [Megalurothrips usitatus]
MAAPASTSPRPPRSPRSRSHTRASSASPPPARTIPVVKTPGLTTMSFLAPPPTPEFHLHSGEPGQPGQPGQGGEAGVRRRATSFTRAEDIREQEAKEYKSRQDRP